MHALQRDVLVVMHSMRLKLCERERCMQGTHRDIASFSRPSGLRWLCGAYVHWRQVAGQPRAPFQRTTWPWRVGQSGRRGTPAHCGCPDQERCRRKHPTPSGAPNKNRARELCGSAERGAPKGRVCWQGGRGTLSLIEWRGGGRGPILSHTTMLETLWGEALMIS